MNEYKTLYDLNLNLKVQDKEEKKWTFTCQLATIIDTQLNIHSNESISIPIGHTVGQYRLHQLLNSHLFKVVTTLSFL